MSEVFVLVSGVLAGVVVGGVGSSDGPPALLGRRTWLRRRAHRREVARLSQAWPDHLASVRRRVIDHLAGLDLQALTAAFAHVVEAAEDDGH